MSGITFHSQISIFLTTGSCHTGLRGGFRSDLCHTAAGLFSVSGLGCYNVPPPETCGCVVSNKQLETVFDSFVFLNLVYLTALNF